MTIPKWYNNEHDRFPGEYYCYIKMSFDAATGITFVHDVKYSNVPLRMKND